MPGFVAVIDPDVDRIRLRTRNVLDHCTNALRLGEVSRGRNLRTCGRLVRWIYCVNVKILIAALVLNEKDVLSVA